jgi:trk system potassium uptake protein TrkA
MRIVLVGATSAAEAAARILVDRGHRLVMVDTDRQRMDELSDKIDCSMLHGDGSNPAILREAGPEQTDVLVCMTDHDQVNIIASLVGRSLKFPRVVTVITDTEFESICLELGLEETVVPVQMIGRDLADMVEGKDTMEFSSVIKGEAQVFKFMVTSEEEGPVGDLPMPARAEPICFYRDGEFHLIEEGASLRQGDELVILTYRDVLPKLEKQWKPEPLGESGARAR